LLSLPFSQRHIQAGGSAREKPIRRKTDEGMANRNRLLRGADKPSIVNDSPEERPLRTASFVVHATRGVIRDQTTRRKTMFVLLVVALVLLFGGSTFLGSILNPHEHPGWFIFYWFVCGWLTLTAMLLALFDLLIVRAQARKAERLLRGEVSDAQSPDASRK
jgi:hypothetical protein